MCGIAAHGVLARTKERRGKLTCDEGVGDCRRSCWRDRSAIVCLWREERAFDGPHIEEAMVMWGTDRLYGIGMGGEERLLYGWEERGGRDGWWRGWAGELVDEKKTIIVWHMYDKCYLGSAERESRGSRQGGFDIQGHVNGMTSSTTQLRTSQHQGTVTYLIHPTTSPHHHHLHPSLPPDMPPQITIIPLGTSSAVPSSTRNQSSLAILLPSSSALLIDVGEGTQHQLQRFRSIIPHVKLSKIEKIFITHLHGDHVFGLCPLLATLMNGAGGAENDPRVLDTAVTGPSLQDVKPRIELYGPQGLREYVRLNLTLTHTHLDGLYVVHELHLPNATPPDPTATLYPKELPTGRNIHPNAAGLWRDVCLWPHATQGYTEFTLSAAPITHTVPSVGYVLVESALPGKIPSDYAKRIATHKAALVESSGYTNPMEWLRLLQSPMCPADTVLELPDGSRLFRPPLRPGRKITVLGDTSDPSAIIPLALGSDVLVHEATNAWLPGVDPLTKESEDYAAVEERARSRGHSTPEMAGRFARAIGLGARRDAENGREGLLILNHFSSRYKDDLADGPAGQAQRVMHSIRTCAWRAWVGESAAGSGLSGREIKVEGRKVVCARDGVPIGVKA